MDDEPKYSCKGLSFIRVLDHDYSKQVQIPQEFTAKFNGNVPRRFIIESTLTKKCWRVEVEKDVDGQMYFRGGWPAFVESHSLEAGSFLIFEYEEQSIFHVKVYGRNGCEKTIPKNFKGGQHKLERTTEFEELRQSEVVKCDERILRKHQEQKRMKELSPKESEHGIHKKQHVVVNDRVRTAIASISKNSVSFSITFHKLKKHQFTQLTIPKAAALLKLQNKRKVMLQNVKGDCWPVNVAHCTNGRRLFSGGWKSFVEANGFVAGDTLDFEFISNNLVRVVARKTSEVDDQVVGHDSEMAEHQSKANSMDGYDLGKNAEFEELGKKEAFKCDERILRNHQERKRTREHSPKENELDIDKKQHPFGEKKTKTVNGTISEDRVCFSIILHQQKNYQFQRQEIPKAISSQKQLWNKEKVILQDAKGNSWPVKVVHRRDGRGIFTQGWKNFLKKNGYIGGDTLNFEFTSDNIIQVHVTKASHVDHHSEDQAKCPNKVTGMLGEDNEPSTTSDDKAIEDSNTAKNESSELGNSTFSFTWNETTTAAFLNIPNKVAKAQNLMNKDTILFQDTEGKSWPLQVRTWWDGRVVLTKGWVEFWKGHSISEGDSLHLEFMPTSLIQVTINKGNPKITSANQVLESKNH